MILSPWLGDQFRECLPYHSRAATSKLLECFAIVAVFRGVAVCAGVDANRNLLTGLIPSFSRVLQACVGVGAEGQQLFLAIELVLEAPSLAALGTDEKE